MMHLKLLPFIVLLPVLVACNETKLPVDGGNTSGDQDPDSLATEWETSTLVTLAEDGLLQTNIQTVIDGNVLQVFYYDVHQPVDNLDTAQYELRNLSWDLASNSLQSAPETVVSLDNSRSLSVALAYEPQVAYQGGNIRECQGSEQSDAMLAMHGNTWLEQTAAIGFVERTMPILEDGFAGGAMSLAIDDSGNRHLAFQFFYEGCDQNPFVYPDLHYVSLLSGVDYSDPDDAPDEEQVDGNVLATDDNANFNKLVGTGDVNELLLDEQGDPLVFYSAEDPDLTEGKIGLKLARRSVGVWNSEWLIDDCVVEGLDAAVDSNGKLGLALYTTRCDGTENYDPQLHYLSETQTGWQKQTLVMPGQAGQYPSLAFDENNQPVIAFYEIATYQSQPLRNLKIARRSEQGWQINDVSNLENVGQYNRLHILDSGEAVIVSYLASARKIVLFRADL